jgi:putative transposase
MQTRRPLRHPPHVYMDDTWYIITASVYGRYPLLAPAGHKDIMRDLLKALTTEFHIRLSAWVILNNHYHILAKSRTGDDLAQFIGRLHGRASYEINSHDHVRGRQVWHNYWDTCIRTENDYWTRFNYIHHNPVKHGYAGRMEDWPFSSYRYYLEHKGTEWLADTFRLYPIIDFTDSHD